MSGLTRTQVALELVPDPSRGSPLSRVASPSAYVDMAVQVHEGRTDAAARMVTHPGDVAAECRTNFVAMEAQVLQEAFVDPFTNAPTDNRAAMPGHILSSALGMLGAVEQIQYAGIAALTAPLAAMSVPLPALTLTSMGLGIPHAHTHPPSTIPPAPPCPMPSFGAMLIPGAINVLLGGLPAARAGDVGMIVTCVSLGPPVEVALGSSNTFFGGSRGSRVGTDIFFHDNPSPLGAGAAMMAAAGAAAQLLTAAGQAADGEFMAAGMTVAQQQADAAAMVLKQLRKIDPGMPPDVGMFLTGSFTVLVGGLAFPPAMDLASIVGALRGLAGRIARRLRRNTAAAEGTGAGHCGTGNCPQ